MIDKKSSEINKPSIEHYKTNTWALLGEELGKKQNVLKKIITDIETNLEKTHPRKDPANSIKNEIEHFKFFLSDDNIESVTNEILGAALFTKYKIIILEQIDSLNAADNEILANALKTIDAGVFVILLSEGNKLHKSVDSLIEKKHKQTFWKLSNSDLENYIQNYLYDTKTKMDPETISLIIHLAGNHTGEIKTLLYSITQYAKSLHSTDIQKEQDEDTFGKTVQALEISKEDIQKWISHYKPESIFSLFERLSNYRFNEAFTILASLISENNSPIESIAGLVYLLRNSLKIKKGLEVGMTVDKIFTMLNIRGYTIQHQYRNFIQDIPSFALEKMICICENTDSAMRSGFDKRYQRILISTMLYEIVSLMKNPNKNISTQLDFALQV